ncbi:DEAD/DEAH box helicase [Streptomyces spectabilis]|uniref:Superfamily II DNA or RNA helicase n=2 Tax=Streptomyces spectabilis TaxID=68270 RepID=A0A7W8B5M5_STRST|nr:DEAD/DEAH box helicase [Streptomyces spectabilis]MBB5109013.1 superfamily II DNA or RNA helicase [Streptomyces spectabilis]
MSFTATAATQAARTSQDLTAWDAGQWHEALRDLLAGADADDGVLAREAIRRSQAGLLSIRDMRLVLLATGSGPSWAPARQAVIDALADTPDIARQVLVTHTQVEVWPPPQFEERPHAPDGTGVTFAAQVGPNGSKVTGPARSASTAREAKVQASLALLARLAGVRPPGSQAATGEADRLVLPGMPTEVFELHLRHDVATGHGPSAELEQEALQRARTGRLRHRDLYLLLLEARGDAWTAVREAAFQRAAAMRPAPARLLHWHAEQCGGEDGLTYVEEPADAQGRHHTRAQISTGERTLTGPVRSSQGRKTARHYAACALLAQLAGLAEPACPADSEPEPTPKITIPGQGQDPVKYLNKHHQLGCISKPAATVRTLGTRTELTYTCEHLATSTLVKATAAGPGKTLARQAAALKLLRKLSSLDHTTPVTPASASAPVRAEQPSPRAEPAPAPAPAASPAPATGDGGVQLRPAIAVEDRPAHALLLDAITCGCAVTFTPPGAGRSAQWWVQDNGRRALPMTGLPGPLSTGRGPDGTRGWHVPLLEGLPVLHRAHRDASTTAVFWQRALHIALQLIAARLIYPALTGDGHATWRIGPLPAAARQALSDLAAAAPPGAAPPALPAGQALCAAGDALADALVRTPAAAMFAASPWTSPTGPVAPVDAATQQAVRGWLDGVEEKVDGGPAPQLILRVHEPSNDQAAAGRLTTELYLSPAGTAPEAQDPVPAGHVWSGGFRLSGQDLEAVRPRVLRALRRAARRCPALAGLAGQDHPQRSTLHPAAIEALLEQEAELAGQGVRVMWPERLRTALQATAVIGTQPAADATGHRPAGQAPRFSVSALLDFRWQVALNGVALSEQEMDALAEAARPLVRVRDQWVLADPVLRCRARHRLLGQLPGTQALTAALTGTVTIDDASVPCRPTGQLADMIGVLTGGEHHPQTVPAPSRLQATLRGYQLRALTWLAHTSRLGFGAVLADDMGLGKTLTALAFTLHHQQHTPGPALVICPASLVTTWCREAARFAPNLATLAYHGPERSLQTLTDTTVVVTTYGILLRDQSRLAARRWSLVIADEAQHAKNPASATARHLRTLPATTRLALTGTPVENNLSELWALLDWTNPDLFGTLRAFRARWANTAEKDPTSPQAAELGRVIAPFLLRRRKSDPGIAPELPPKIDLPRLVQLTTEQAGLYEALVRETLQQIRASRGITRNGLVFKLLTALKQITNHPAHYLREHMPGETEDERAAFTARSAKTAALMELLQAIRLRGEATLLFTSYVAMGRLLHHLLDQHGYDPLFLHGATPLPERQRMVDAFQAGQHPVMILSLKAAGTGLTLTRAGHVIHYDRSWNAAVEDQATDRAHRIGQQQTVTVHRLITEHTVEDRIDELLTHKRALASAVLTGGERAFTQLTDRELTDLVTLKGHP